MRWPTLPRHLRFEPKPDRPRDVVAVLDNGKHVSCECAYVGTSPDGIRQWVAIVDLSGRRVRRMTIGHLPGRTEVSLAEIGRDK